MSTSVVEEIVTSGTDAGVLLEDKVEGSIAGSTVVGSHGTSGTGRIAGQAHSRNVGLIEAIQASAVAGLSESGHESSGIGAVFTGSAGSGRSAGSTTNWARNTAGAISVEACVALAGGTGTSAESGVGGADCAGGGRTAGNTERVSAGSAE